MTKNQVNHLVARLRGEGAVLWEENGKLRYRAPRGMLHDSDLQAMKEHKEAIVQLLLAEAKPVMAECHPELRYEPFPLTDVQSAYLLGRNEAFGYGGVACHIYLELTYPELDRNRTEEAWNRLVKRHDMLRAVIHRDGYQEVQETVPRLEVAYTDGSAWEKDKVAATLTAIREDMGHRIYAADSWPFFGVAVTKTSEQSVLHFSIDFLIADWTSIWLLLAEFESFYYRQERPLPELTFSFRDYLITERGIKESAVYLKAKQYWLNRIDELPPAPELPAVRLADHPGRARFSRRFLQLDAPIWNQFKQTARQCGLTPTSAVLTAYAAVIERWSHKSKFCLNLTVLNRLPFHEQVQRIVGDFTSVSLLAVDWDAGQSFGERAAAITKQLFADLDHRLFSGVEVLREVARRRGREAALMPVVFTSAIGLIEPTQDNQLRGKTGSEGISQTPQVFIDCQAMDSPNGLQVNWDVREGVFPAGMTDDMFDAFAALLRLLAGAEQAWGADEIVPLPGWQSRERQAINATAAPLPDCLLHSDILRQAAINPERLAVLDGQGPVTYRELVLRASAIAEELKKTGCRGQDRVAVIMDKSAHQAASVLAVLLVGAVYVPIDPLQPALRRAVMLKNTKVRHVLTCSANRIEWPDDLIVMAVDGLEPRREPILAAAGDPDLPAYIIYTSGSTGQPKGVVVTHRAAMNTIRDINDRFAIRQNDRVLGLAELSFDLSVYDLFGVLSAGGGLIYPSADRKNDPSHWAGLMLEHKVTVWNSVPALMQMLLAYLQTEPELRLPAFRLALLSGDWIPLPLPARLLAYAPDLKIISLGGATEASIWSIFHAYEGVKPEWSSIPYGRPLANQGFRVLDEQLRECPVWVTGELYITGAGLAQGYFGDEEHTNARFFLHPIDGQRLYRTGDIGRYMPGGEIEFLGREDNQVKIKGHRIELGEIEAALQKHPAVAAAAVVLNGTGDARSLSGFVEMARSEEREEPVSPSELRQYLSRYLPAYMIPADWQIVGKLPLTGNGKIDRQELGRWKTQGSGGCADSGTEPGHADLLEKQLNQVWAEALGLPRIGRTQNFYEHGADSLIMAQVAGQLRDMLTGEPFGLAIAFDAILRQMLNYPTVAELAGFVRAQGRKAGQALPADAAQEQPDGKSAGNAVLTAYGGGEGPLRVVFHAGLGTMNGFRLLLPRLTMQNSGPVLGITVADTDLYCSLEPAGLIERLADDYAGRLKETGHTEVQLIGYSLGGLIAVEVARRLLEQGVQVIDLVLIDSHPVLYEIDDDLVMEVLFVPNLNISLAQAGFSGVQPEEISRGLWRVFNANQSRVPAGASLTIGGDEGLDKVGGLFQRLAACSQRERFTAYVEAMAVHNGVSMPVEMAEGLFRSFRHSLKSARFIPPPYMGNIRFLLAREPFTLLPGADEMTLDFWRDICLGEFSAQEIAGNHFSCIGEEANADSLAALIGEVLVNK